MDGSRSASLLRESRGGGDASWVDALPMRLSVRLQTRTRVHAVVGLPAYGTPIPVGTQADNETFEGVQYRTCARLTPIRRGVRPVATGCAFRRTDVPIGHSNAAGGLTYLRSGESARIEIGRRLRFRRICLLGAVAAVLVQIRDLTEVRSKLARQAAAVVADPRCASRPPVASASNAVSQTCHTALAALSIQGMWGPHIANLSVCA